MPSIILAPQPLRLPVKRGIDNIDLSPPSPTHSPAPDIPAPLEAQDPLEGEPGPNPDCPLIPLGGDLPTPSLDDWYATTSLKWYSEVSRCHDLAKFADMRIHASAMGDYFTARWHQLHGKEKPADEPGMALLTAYHQRLVAKTHWEPDDDLSPAELPPDLVNYVTARFIAPFDDSPPPLAPPTESPARAMRAPPPSMPRPVSAPRMRPVTQPTYYPRAHTPNISSDDDDELQSGDELQSDGEASSEMGPEPASPPLGSGRRMTQPTYYPRAHTPNIPSDDEDEVQSEDEDQSDDEAQDDNDDAEGVDPANGLQQDDAEIAALDLQPRRIPAVAVFSSPTAAPAQSILALPPDQHVILDDLAGPQHLHV